MHLYIMEIQDYNWCDQDERFLPFVSCERRDRIKRYIFDIDKKLSLYGALLIRTGIIKKLNCENNSLKFALDEYGKPHLLNNRDLYFNMSHTRNAVICGVADVPIGVDIERIAEPCYDITEKCFHNDERALLGAQGNEQKELFFKLWTQKEAYTKCSGVGICQDLTKINVLDKEVQEKIITGFYADYVYSVYLEKSMEEVNLVKMTVDSLAEIFMRKHIDGRSIKNVMRY
ncbi:4'-phosphopantetheinyl transferase family protein [Anaerocolumna xylanovorans]|uniref:4'-phosphopantetheinyl transferase n=1 Tax=Anaerocolumna xylanovorans DSM 12503 TaxID=1121345 RepID=A0A1M7Y5E0_9FIRM|nr:4'-phosphopantetheinyl transferase superfamily protein [Anaerocolumna xylanovorans]SHO47735.1 4'-phosphopantetheinyl transferase [Anaerocolumna xylanovorans DSM 12503]